MRLNIGYKEKRFFLSKIGTGYIIICLFILIGIILGCYTFHGAIIQGNSYFLKMTLVDNADQFKTHIVLSKVLLKNIRLFTIFWLLGMSIVCIPIMYILIIVNSYNWAIVISFVIKKMGLFSAYRFIFTVIYFDFIIELIFSILLIQEAMKMAKNVIENKGCLANQEKNYSLIGLLIIIIIVLASFAQVFLYRIWLK